MRGGLHAVSLFAGIGGFELALFRAGIPTVAAVESDPAARGVLADRFPTTTLLNDIREVTGDDIRATGFDPARGIVTAGWPCQGNSVAGHREGMDDPRSGLWSHVVRLLDELRPAWFLGENVPGLLSVNDGRDFATVIGDLARLGMGVCWRVLDAQHFGVPQRRRRVFIVGRAGDDRGPVQVLLEPDRGGGHPTPRRPARPDPTPVAALRAGNGGGCGPDDNDATGGRLIVGPIQAAGSGGRGHRVDAEGAATGHLIAALTTRAGATYDDQQTGQLVPIAFDTTYVPLGSQRVAHALTAEGHDASEDGTGRGTPLIAVSMAVAGDISTGIDVAQTVRAAHGQPGVIAWQGGSTQDQIVEPGGISPTLAHSSAAHMGHHQPKLAVPGQAVRRLTPTECERLQGFPDGWTATSNGQPQADSPRYRQLGNAVAVPVAAWIAHRILTVELGTTP